MCLKVVRTNKHSTGVILYAHILNRREIHQQLSNRLDRVNTCPQWAYIKSITK